MTGRMRFRRKASVGAAIPTASMADISFLLLVFFMVSTVFVRYRGIPVDLPEAEKIEKLAMRRHIAHIWINSEGAINIDDQMLTLDKVAEVQEHLAGVNTQITKPAHNPPPPERFRQAVQQHQKHDTHGSTQ